MAVSAAISQTEGNISRGALVVYEADGNALLPEGATVGITVQTLLGGVEVDAAAAYLQTVPAGGQTGKDALIALGLLIEAGCRARTSVSENVETGNHVLIIEPINALAGGGGTDSVVLTLPVMTTPP